MNEKAVVERIVDGRKAVLLVGEGEAEHIIDVNQLPQGTKEGDWLKVRFAGGESLVQIELDSEETSKVKQRIEDKMIKLRERSGSKFRKS